MAMGDLYVQVRGPGVSHPGVLVGDLGCLLQTWGVLCLPRGLTPWVAAGVPLGHLLGGTSWGAGCLVVCQPWGACSVWVLPPSWAALGGLATAALSRAAPHR